MARESKSARNDRIHEEAVQEFDRIISANIDERQQCLQDRRFYSIAGAQWEGLEEQFENRPRFEVNKVHLSVIKIFNEFRANPISVTFRPKDGDTDDQQWADKVQSLFRADEDDSNAQEAYDNAFEEGVGGGIGAMRLRTCYEDDEDDDNDKQRIRIEPIFDADSTVFWDLDAKRADKADAKTCFVITPMSHAAYMAEWDDDPASWPKEVHQTEFDWATPDVVNVAEYYRVEDATHTVNVFMRLDGEEERHTDEALDANDGALRAKLAATGARLMRQKRVKRKRVHKWIMSGARVLEDCGIIAGKCIPIVMNYGKRWVVDGVERAMGQVRLAKDAQRLKNMQLSKLAEISSLSTVEKPILHPEQVAGHEVMWAEDNRKNYPYQLINPISGPNGEQTIAGPIGYTKVPQIPPAMAATMAVVDADMAEILGSGQGAEEIRANTSAEAVGMVQQRLDMQPFIFISNFARAMRRLGEVWLSMAKDVYVEDKRVMKTVSEAGKAGQVTLREPDVDDEGRIIMANDFGAGDFDVVVDVGPSSQSRRASTVRSVVGLMSVSDDPMTRQILTSVALANLEGEGLGDVNEFFRQKLVTAGVVKPTEEEAAAMQAAAANAPPDPNAVLAQSLAEEATAKAAKARADTVLTIANAEKARADTEKTKAETLQTVADLDAGSRSQFGGG